MRIVRIVRIVGARYKRRFGSLEGLEASWACVRPRPAISHKVMIMSYDPYGAPDKRSQTSATRNPQPQPQPMRPQEAASQQLTPHSL